MSEERITETTDAQGNTHTTRVVSDGGSGGGMAKWAFLLVLVIALGVAGFLLTQTNTAEIAKDNAITEAAQDVGEAAGQVGEAAQEAGEAARDAAENMGG
ncbi:hypothetical protein MWU38_14100 [Qipengyuania sp. S6317L1]|uniref:hypothetical protein n=1 Tax=Qipengyuania sp. S6317L1 TaxID=2926410 RepID=UPI001FF4B18B|nr:hypothetical protein [Qipengyuania sp. S6317L1]MCK0100514.1 hypothetical protein [Qipengyuania sp. S6317L1]